MFKVGPNPYGLCCTLGLQANLPKPKDVWWFIELAESTKACCIEFHFLHLSALSDDERNRVRDRIQEAGLEPIISGPWPLDRITESIPVAHQLGVRTVRTHLSPILCGDRAAQGDKWTELNRDIRTKLVETGPAFADASLCLAIENHQDFGSEELLEFCEIGGPAMGITLDTGNPLAVGEDPISFAKRVAPNVRHVHLKDYRAQATPEGYRLVRCAIGDGAVPLAEIHTILANHHQQLTASLEPGALESRHVRLLTKEWWNGYPERTPDQIKACLNASTINAIPAGEDYRTPLERGETSEQVSAYEVEQMEKSVKNMQQLGWLPK